MKTSRSHWYGGSTNADQLPAGLIHKRFRRLSYWVRAQSASFRKLWAVRLTANCGRVSAFAHRVVGYHGSFIFDWLDDHHVSRILVTGTRRHSVTTVGECVDGTFCWVFCSAANEPDALDHEDVVFVAGRIASRYACQDLTGVYFISNGRGAVKIGLSNGHMYDRLKTLQLSNPDDLTLIAVAPSESPEALEHALHCEFSSRLIRNEWFRMDEDEAREAARKNGGFALQRLLVDTK